MIRTFRSQIFQRLEEESAQRAREEEERDRLEAEAEGRPTAQEVADEVIPTNASAPKARRRTSISVSRFGQPTDVSPTATQPPSTRASRSSSIVTRPAFYQLDARYHPATSSADSFATSDTPSAEVEEVESSVTQHLWAPRPSISKAISRRLSRARDVVPLPATTGNGSLIIDVAVEEATVEHPVNDDDIYGVHGVSTTKVFTGTLRTQRSSPGIQEKAGWVTKAKDITLKLRRKSIAVLNSGPVSPR